MQKTLGNGGFAISAIGAGGMGIGDAIEPAASADCYARGRFPAHLHAHQPLTPTATGSPAAGYPTLGRFHRRCCPILRSAMQAMRQPHG